MFETPICPTCGCSLVRLGITKENAINFSYKEKVYSFCCTACLDVFKSNAEVLLRETANLIVCPACLAEKSVAESVEYEYNGVLFNFCRCPFCLDLFKKNPDYYIKRLAGQTDYAGVFSEQEKCCTPN